MLILNLLTLSVLIYVQISFCESFLIKNIYFNVNQFKRHKTEHFYRDYDGMSKVIVRRADYFRFSVELNEDYNDEQIQATMTFNTKIDRMVIKLPSGSENSEWSMRQQVKDQRIFADIHIPSNAPVGVWDLQISLKNSNGSVVEKLQSPHQIVILFNPWSPEDAAYFPETEKLDEYLLNEGGCIFSYNFVKWGSRRWIYGQFQTKVFDAILFVLDRAKLTAAQRGDIVLVSRELTYLMNDDGRRNRGVLRGKWKEPYNKFEGRPAVRPTEWTGSPSVFEKYYQSGGKTVAYGQCWVYAGILVTAYRALGIASRPVTTSLAAASRRRDLTVDIYLSKTGNVKYRESVWNYHVWVQAWFNRSSDLGDEYSGWQDLDGTPKELNDGRYQLGPASNTAIGNSTLRNRFETSFFYEEVNADEVIWLWPEMKVMSINRRKIGGAVLTNKYVCEAEDITRMYKPPENTTEERRSYRLAAESLEIKPPSLKLSPRSSKQYITIDIQTPKQIMIGSPVSSKIILKNLSLRTKNLQVDIRATAMYYNGEAVGDLKFVTHNISVAGAKAVSIEFNFKPEDYIGKLRDKYTIRIQAIARIGKVIAFQEKLFALQTPKLIIKAPKSVELNKTFTMDIEIKNPFKQTLTDCYIAFEGTRIERKVVKINDISGSSVKKATLQMKSLHANTETVVVQFHSSDLLQMQSSAEIKVYGKQLYRFQQYVITNTNGNKSTTAGSQVIPKTSIGVRTITRKSFHCCTMATFD